MQQLSDFLKSGQYLPPAFRDFHDQKRLFGRIQEMSDRYDWSARDKPSWVAAHCYVIDIFLWFMAMHGYTLQKTRHKVEGVRCMDEVLEEFDRRRYEAFAKQLEERKGDD